ncbi:MAG: hypothetical protein QOJ68_3451 [Blastococcus sp.]|jgi:uncharacterized membrane protein|nr:hypothetical protein [Blastococcus sp.]
MLLVLVPIGIATLVGLLVLWPGGKPSHAQQVATTYVPPGTTYPEARVLAVATAPCAAGATTAQNTCGTAMVTVLDGPGAGERRQIDLPPDVVAAGVHAGDRLVLSRGTAEGSPDYQFYDYSRRTPIVVLAIAFAVVVGLVARWRGLRALLGLGFAFAVLLWFVLPGLLAEKSPTLVSLVGSAAIMFVVLYLAHGFSARTTTALLGTLFGLALIAVLGSIAVSVARLTGLTTEETLTLNNFDPTLKFSAIVLAGVVVAGLGVLNDVTITQASAVWELREASPEMTVGELFRRAMAIGRDHIASTVYTIVFAYAGAALPSLLLFELYQRPFWTVLTGSVVAEEVIRILVGGIALVLAVPVTTAIGAIVARVADSPVALAAGPGSRRLPAGLRL